MRALVMGAGVAGSVAAMALQKAGWEPVIFEAYAESAGLGHGVFLTVAVNGLDALRAIDAHHIVTSAGFPSERIDFSNGRGRRLGSIPLGPKLTDGTVTHTIRRSDLYHGLYREAAARGIPIEHGKRLVRAEELPGGGVTAHFADGTSATGDLLIGADGVHSATRKIIDPGAPDPRYTGLGNTGGFARVPDIDATPGEYSMIWGRECFFGYTVSPDGEVWWFANPPRRQERDRAELRTQSQAELRALLLDLLAEDSTPGAAIVRATTDDFRLTNQYDLPRVATWHNSSMVIIGDAAHAVSPASGQGCSLAAEDAVVLAQCLRDAPTVAAALAGYEQQRRDRVERVVTWGSSMNNTKKQGLIGRALRDLVLPLILRSADSPREMQKMSWLFNHHIEWEANRLTQRRPAAS
ncbi:2-polyprenyl-6-methoxyphenol hydroxylase-like FAD-dependent oxidoreductase [Allocatelliglobosispora scoriae]|uniref:2-polyprenyl-6-methoxyphenol hydroxylase-like FAD-dependent oxidoreductase n=1 Tax=Allocatelliglobosispora scoriae TaxID=643052 RepID=A0A841BTX7_9ACTN|nr:FAD-dependent monooxygenase [Allocatelliglobosispora scoriae]MBB5870202.1 2-polyprenyl-6-methoxyphenol hydroxylase-like FAD-dependent oxidoreductase [Allocatelliglobosispora scoriae]